MTNVYNRVNSEGRRNLTILKTFYPIIFKIRKSYNKKAIYLLRKILLIINIPFCYSDLISDLKTKLTVQIFHGKNYINPKNRDRKLFSKVPRKVRYLTLCFRGSSFHDVLYRKCEGCKTYHHYQICYTRLEITWLRGRLKVFLILQK